MSPLLILVPPLGLLAAAAASRVPLGRRFAPAVTFAGTIVSLVVSLAFARQGAAAIVAVPGWIAADGIGLLVLMLVSLVGALAALYSWGYMSVRASGRSDADLRVYHMYFNLFLFAIVMIPLMSELALLWIVVELTTLLSVMLVGFEGTHQALEAAWKYVVLTLVGAAIALLGILVLYRALVSAGGGPFTWSGLEAAAPRLPAAALAPAFLMVLVGFGAKVGLVPLHTWLPDAHSQAPTPICAILSGVETATILYVILRLLSVARRHPALRADTWAVVFGLISVGAAAFLLVQVTDLKRLFAFSTVEHMGIILAAAGLGGAAYPGAAAYQLLTHGLAKPLCFFAAGAALLVYRTSEIGATRGLIRTSPAAGVGLLIGGLAVTGAPPFALFLSELAILQAGVTRGAYVAVAALALFIVVAFAGVAYHLSRIVFGPGPAPAAERAGTRVRLPATVTAAIALAAIPVIALGVFMPPWVQRLLDLSGLAISGGAG